MVRHPFVSSAATGIGTGVASHLAGGDALASTFNGIGAGLGTRAGISYMRGNRNGKYRRLHEMSNYSLKEEVFESIFLDEGLGSSIKSGFSYAKKHPFKTAAKAAIGAGAAYGAYKLGSAAAHDPTLRFAAGQVRDYAHRKAGDIMNNSSNLIHKATTSIAGNAHNIGNHLTNIGHSVSGHIQNAKDSLATRAAHLNNKNVSHDWSGGLRVRDSGVKGLFQAGKIIR